MEGLTPERHAQNKGNVSYLKMVERKIQHKKSPFVSLIIQEQNPKKKALITGGLSDNEDLSAIIELPEVTKNFKPKSNQSCRNCRSTTRRSSSSSGMVHLRMHRPLLLMMVAVAALCATVALFFKTPPHLESVLYSLKWEGINYGSS